MKSFAKIFLLLATILLGPLFSSAQSTTRTDVTTTATKKTKILVIPWEPRMFNCNSDISHAISAETSQKYDQIEETFRKGMVDKLKASFGSTYNVISLIDDTAKMNADLHYVYTCTTMSYTPVTFPLNATKADSAKLKTDSGVQNGQVAATSDDVDKFMNTIIISPNLLAYLQKKYSCDYVLFINEVDMDNDLSADPYNYSGKTDFNRIVTMHWTMFNALDGKRVAMGKNKSTFISTNNTPKKIIDASFSVIATAIDVKFVAGIKPKQ